MTKIDFETVNFILSNVSNSDKFICNDGNTLNNLEELIKKLKAIDEKDFASHVNKEKNDFSSWIYNCIGDIKLAEDIRSIKDSVSMNKKIKARVAYLKKKSKDKKND